MPFLKHIATYKRFSSYVELESCIEVPDIQRSLMQKQLNNMELYIQECVNKSIEPVFGTIDLVQIKGNPKLQVVDGQHRFFAIKNMATKGVIVPIHSMIYEVDNYEGLEDIFRVRNLGVPIPDYYINLKKNSDAKIGLIQKISAYLESNYGGIFSYRRNTRPYMNLNIFMELLIKSKVYTIINTEDDFVKVLHQINLKAYEYLIGLDEKGKRRLGITQNMINVWSENQMYIPYDSNFTFLSKEYDITILQKLLL